MDYYTIYISIIFLIKIVFVILATVHLYLKFKNKTDSDLDKQVLFWRERTEFIFTSLMAILLIYLFNPIKNKMFMINNETRLLLYLFGIVLIITANWKIFFKESDVFKKIQFVV
jgi:hypothetical protein